jgi:cytochrome c-type biogenesis protein CcmE
VRVWGLASWGPGRRRGGAGAEGVNVDDDLDTVITIKPLGDMPAVHAVGQVVVAHGMMHVGQMELIRTLVGARSVVSV